MEDSSNKASAAPQPANKSVILVICLLMQHTSRLVLLPFYPEFIDKYTHWMKDPELLRETGSEELSREDVKEIQERYNSDTNKDFCFIMCDRSLFDWITPETDTVDPSRRTELVGGILGDINLFSANPALFEINVLFGPNKDHDSRKLLPQKGTSF